MFFGGPTLVAGLVPWLLTGWDADDQPLALRILGVVLLVLGAALVVETTTRFALQGRGTPAPWAPPERFVARGSYRVMRNPMYVGVLALILGQALLLGREILFAWAAAAWLLFHLFVALRRGARSTTSVRRRSTRPTATGWPGGCLASRSVASPLGSVFGNVPDVRLDLAGADEFSVISQSLPRTDPQSA